MNLNEQQTTFESWKYAIAKESTMKIFDLEKNVILITDTSEYSMSAILWQQGHSVLYLSRGLMTAESNYSNRERGFSNYTKHINEAC